MVKEAVAKGRGVQEPSELAPGPATVSAGRYQSWPQAPSWCLQEDIRAGPRPRHGVCRKMATQAALRWLQM